jgi:hypothetical protein
LIRRLKKQPFLNQNGNFIKINSFFNIQNKEKRFFDPCFTTSSDKKRKLLKTQFFEEFSLLSRNWWQTSNKARVTELVKDFAVYLLPSIKIHLSNAKPENKKYKTEDNKNAKGNKIEGLLISPTEKLIFIYCSCGCKNAYDLKNWLSHVKVAKKYGSNNIARNASTKVKKQRKNKANHFSYLLSKVFINKTKATLTQKMGADLQGSYAYVKKHGSVKLFKILLSCNKRSFYSLYRGRQLYIKYKSRKVNLKRCFCKKFSLFPLTAQFTVYLHIFWFLAYLPLSFNYLLFSSFYKYLINYLLFS